MIHGRNIALIKFGYARLADRFGAYGTSARSGVRTKFLEKLVGQPKFGQNRTKVSGQKLRNFDFLGP